MGRGGPDRRDPNGVAQDQSGNFSAPAQVAVVPAPDVTAPGSPISFTAAADYAGNVTLTWTNDAGAPYTSIIITRTGAEDRILAGGELSFSDPSLDLGDYTYGVIGAIDLSKTSIGRDLSKRIIIKDMNLHLEEGDVIFYYSSGVKNVTTDAAITPDSSRLSLPSTACDHPPTKPTKATTIINGPGVVSPSARPSII